MEIKMKCRTDKVREEIVSRYELHPIAHLKLLDGQSKESCTGETLSDTYYCFSYKSRQSSESGSFYCGSHAAAHFLKLLNSKPLPLFNPLISVGGSTGNGGSNPGDTWDKVSKQLYNAINLILVKWDSSPGPAIKSIKEDIENNFNKTPSLSLVKSVNTIISRDKSGLTLQQMIAQLRSNNNIRVFAFNLLNAMLAQHGITSYFG